jgi:hypothetical protein
MAMKHYCYYKNKGNTNCEVFYFEKNHLEYFHFKKFLDEIFLGILVDKETGKQRLLILKKESVKKIFKSQRLLESQTKFKKKIFSLLGSVDCIHTVITRISYEEYNKQKDNEFVKDKKQKEYLNALVTDHRKEEADLLPKEHFKAFKIWMEGICECGLNSLMILDEIHKYNRHLLSISKPIFKALMSSNTEYIQLFLNEIEKKCVFENNIHWSSLIANYQLVINTLNIKFKNGTKNSKRYFSYVEHILDKVPKKHYDKSFKKLERYYDSYLNLSNINTIKSYDLKEEIKNHIKNNKDPNKIMFFESKPIFYYQFIKQTSNINLIELEYDGNTLNKRLQEYHRLKDENHIKKVREYYSLKDENHVKNNIIWLSFEGTNMECLYEFEKFIDLIKASTDKQKKIISTNSKKFQSFLTNYFHFKYIIFDNQSISKTIFKKLLKSKFVPYYIRSGFSNWVLIFNEDEKKYELFQITNDFDS